MSCYDGLLQDEVGNGRHEQNAAIENGRLRSEVVLPHPSRHKGKEREPEEQVQVGPEDRPAHMLRDMEHVVMIVPVDADIDEAQDVAEEDRQERPECREVAAERNLHLQDHDGDDDGEDAVTECFHPILAHGSSLSLRKAQGAMSASS